MGMVRARANIGFSGAGTDVRHGEVVEVDAASWAPWIEAGYLTVLDSYDADDLTWAPAGSPGDVFDLSAVPPLGDGASLTVAHSLALRADDPEVG